MRLKYGLSTLGIVLLTAITAQAQITFVQKETRNGQSTTSQIQMDKDHIRAESRDGNDENAFVFDATTQTARIINISKKTYMEMNKAEMDQMGKQLASAMAQMQEQMK